MVISRLSKPGDQDEQAGPPPYNTSGSGFRDKILLLLTQVSYCGCVSFTNSGFKVRVIRDSDMATDLLGPGSLTPLNLLVTNDTFFKVHLILVSLTGEIKIMKFNLQVKVYGQRDLLHGLTWQLPR